MISSLKLEVGKIYRARSGEVYTVRKSNFPPGHEYPFEIDPAFLSVDGKVWPGGPEDEDDLIEEVPAPQAAPDPVNRPEHYTQGGVECIDAIKAAMSAEEFGGFLRGNVIKYLWRYKLKGGAESLAKAQWYLTRLQAEIA